VSDSVVSSVRAHLVSSIEGPDPTAASVTFLGVEPLDVLRFESPDGLVRYVTLGCSRHPMGDPNELVADPTRGPRAELVLTLRGGYRPARERRTSVRRDMADGVRWLSRHRLLRGLTLVSAATAFAQSMGTGVLVLYVLEVLRLPSSAFGLVLLGTGVGALLGGVLTPALTRRFGRAAMLTGGAVVAALAEGGLALTTSGVVATVLGAVSAAGVMVWNVLTMSLRQSLVPEAVFGRVQGAYRTLVWGGIALGSVAGGVVAHAIGLRALFAVVGGALLLLSGVLGVLLYRHARELTDEAFGEQPAVPVTV